MSIKKYLVIELYLVSNQVSADQFAYIDDSIMVFYSIIFDSLYALGNRDGSLTYKQRNSFPAGLTLLRLRVLRNNDFVVVPKSNAHLINDNNRMALDQV